MRRAPFIVVVPFVAGSLVGCEDERPPITNPAPPPIEEPVKEPPKEEPKAEEPKEEPTATNDEPTPEKLEPVRRNPPKPKPKPKPKKDDDEGGW
jgi:hypothetical protein